MATHFDILAWRIPWTEELGELRSTGLQKSDTTEQLTQKHYKLLLYAQCMLKWLAKIFWTPSSVGNVYIPCRNVIAQFWKIVLYYLLNLKYIEDRFEVHREQVYMHTYIHTHVYISLLWITHAGKNLRVSYIIIPGFLGWAFTWQISSKLQSTQRSYLYSNVESIDILNAAVYSN